MELIIICLVAFLAAILTFFSGFGLGTILAPTFMLFFPVDVAIALTGLVHFFNNVFKLFLVSRHAVLSVLIRFGIPAILASIIGAWVLVNLPSEKTLFSYELFGLESTVHLVEFTIGIILLFFAIIELIPALKNIQFDASKLIIGGLLSGFFGGLSGHQGALRSAFLIKAGLSKEAFIGTAVVVSSLVDFSRISIYATRILDTGLTENSLLIIMATLSAMSGAFIGNKLLKKVTFKALQTTVAIMLIAISLALMSGLLH